MFNKDKIKGFVAGLCVATIVSSGIVFADSISKTVTAVYNNIKIVIDGTQITPTDANGNVVEPFIIDGTTYLPVRAVAQALGKEVNWDGSSNTVYLGEMPEREFYSLDTASLEQFKEKEVLSINGTAINGGLLNFYVAQEATEYNLATAADNFTPSGNLQTITYNSVPMAKVITERALEDIKLVYIGSDAAEKSGYAAKESTKAEIDESYANFLLNFASDEDFDEFCKSACITEKDLETFAKKSFLFESYMNNVYSENLAKEINTAEIEADIRANYITAKHILVEDEALAKEIIQKLNKKADFDTLMKEHNIDPGATERGYTFTKNEMVKPFEEAAYALKVGEHTKTPVKTDYGYHIIYRVAFDETYIQDSIPYYRDAIAKEETNAYIETLRSSASITFTPEYEKYITTIK